MIPEAFIQELLARIDIVDVVERHLPLKKAGANYVACCPFHNEKTPSFTVSPAKQFYHCFGCGAHGSAIGFLMQYSGLTFPEAVETLAGWVGLSVPRQPDRGQRKAAQRPSLAERMAEAARFYKSCLKNSPKAIDYLKSRGLTGEIAHRFSIGYAPDEWQALAAVFPDYRAAELVECGLVIENDEGRRYDRFRDRIMFPIIDGRGEVIAFGGRILGAGEPKYLNSPETPLFRKGEELYGLPQARQAIRAEDCAIVVEGYMDVVALAQFGIANVVAALGTATTPFHVKKLWRQARRVVFCFDGDAAGRKAAWRALEAALPLVSDDVLAGFVFLPAEDDPDSFIRREGSEAFRRLIAQPTPLSAFFLQELARTIDTGSAEGRARLLHTALPHLARLAGAPLLRQQLVRALADVAAVTPDDIAQRLGLQSGVRGRPVPPGSRPRPAPAGIERVLLVAVLAQPKRAARIPSELIDTEQPAGQALAAVCAAIAQGELPAGNLGVLIEHFRGTVHEELLASAMAEFGTDSETDWEGVFLDALERMKQRRLRRQIEALTAKARRGGLDQEERQALAALLAQRSSRGFAEGS